MHTQTGTHIPHRHVHTHAYPKQAHIYMPTHRYAHIHTTCTHKTDTHTGTHIHTAHRYVHTHTTQAEAHTYKTYRAMHIHTHHTSMYTYKPHVHKT